MGGARAAVGIVGAGTMGAGIAQVAVTHGWTVHLLDVDEQTIRAAVEGVRRRLDRLVEKGRLSSSEREEAAGRLRAATPGDLTGSELIIEAVVEDLEVKTGVLRGLLPSLSHDAIIATNTSSLSVTEIGEAIGEAERTVGMHFFNPAPLMKLVEVVAGRRTRPDVVERVAAIAAGWDKRVARAADVPGFIVNHVARPYYLEAFRILEDGYAGVEEIDRAMREIGGFRMGPLELTDLIGQDVNTATSRSVWEHLGRPPLLRPSRCQEQLVQQGNLGRKTGRGAYDYGGEDPISAIPIDRRPLAVPDQLARAVARFSARATREKADEREAYILARILVAIMAQASLARERGVAEREDIDTAIRYGVNYPKGPFEWASEIGIEVGNDLLEALNDTVDDDRFAVRLEAARG